MTPTPFPPVYIIIVNWNGWANTIECLESVFRGRYPDYRVIVCDNGSSDGSLDHIKAWARGRLDAVVSNRSVLRRLTYPPVPKPITFVECPATRTAIPDTLEGECRLVLISSAENRGFAGGCNMGLRYAMHRHDFQYLWLLNNDTVVEPDSLKLMVSRMQAHPAAGMCGSTLLMYEDPGRIWALGGASFNPWFAISRRIGTNHTMSDGFDPDRVTVSMAYVSGGCILVSRDFVAEIGLMDERFFLFYEELDWAVRGKAHYGLVYCPESIVYHKGAGSVYSSGSQQKTRAMVDYHYIRSRVLFTRKHYPWALPTVIVGLIITALNTLRRSGVSRVWNAFAVILKREKKLA